MLYKNSGASELKQKRTTKQGAGGGGRGSNENGKYVLTSRGR